MCVLLDYNFIVKVISKFHHISNLNHCILIESTTLAHGTYELVLEHEEGNPEAQVKLVEISEDPKQSSKEPKASFAQEGKPRSINSNILLYAIYVPIHLYMFV